MKSPVNQMTDYSREDGQLLARTTLPQPIASGNLYNIDEAIEYLHSLVPVQREKCIKGASMKGESVLGFSDNFAAFPRSLAAMQAELMDGGREVVLASFESAISKRQLVQYMAHTMGDVLQPLNLEYCLRIQDMACGDSKNAEKIRAWLQVFDDHLAMVRPHFDREGESKIEQQCNMLFSILAGGVKNVAHVMWSYSVVALELMKSANLPLESLKEHLASLAPSIRRNILAIAGSHDDVFGVLDEAMRRPEVPEELRDESDIEEEFEALYWNLYHQEDFVLDRGLRLKPEFIFEVGTKVRDEFLRAQEDKSGAFVDEPRAGCAGLVMIPSVFNFCMEMTLEVLGDRLGKINDLPSQIDESIE